MRDSLATLYKEKSEGEVQKLDKTVELDSRVSKLERQLPNVLRWNIPILNQLRCNRTTLEQQRNVLHIRFLAAHAGLHRPLFIDYCRSKHRSRDDPESNKPKFFESSQRSAAVECVKHSMKLIEAIDQFADTDATCEWWYSMFFVRLAAAVFIMTKQQVDIVSEVGRESLEKSFELCKGILRHKLPQNELIVSCTEGLDRMYEQVKTAPTINEIADNDTTMPVGELPGMLAQSPWNGMTDFSYMDGGQNEWSMYDWGTGLNAFTEQPNWG